MIRSARGMIASAAMLTTSLLSVASQAAEVRVGLLRQDPVSLWATNSNRERAWAANLEVGFDPLVRILGGDVAPMAGGTLAEGDNLDTAYAGLTWTLSGDALFLRLGLGAVIHSGDVDDAADADRRRQLGSRVLFHVPVEAGVRLGGGPASLSLYFSHMSNGYFADPNPGMDTLGVRLGWQF